MKKPLQKYSRTLTLVIHVDSKRTYKTTCLISSYNLHIYVPNKCTYMFQHHREKLLLVRNSTRRLWVGRMTIFQMNINVSACTLENSPYIFSAKMINKYNDFLQKNIYFKLRKCRAKMCATCATFPSRNFLFQWIGSIFNSKHLKQWKFWVVNKWEVRKNVKAKVKRALFCIWL